MRKRISNLLLPPVTCAAAGSSITDATDMPGAVVSVSAADGTKGIQLPEPSPGRVCAVYNEHATSGLKIYPHTGGDINDAAADAAITIEGKTLAIFIAMDASTWAASYTANT